MQGPREALISNGTAIRRFATKKQNKEENHENNESKAGVFRRGSGDSKR